MLARRRATPPAPLTGELFGVTVTLEAETAQVLEEMRSWLPPLWREGAAGVAPVAFAIRSDAGGGHQLLRDDEPVESGALDIVIGSFELQLRNHVAQHAPDHVFIHAGTVAHGGQAIVIPGQSFSGKTTLVTELVRAGATYFSDEYAVLDRSGMVHPYPKPIAIRDGGSGFRGKSYHDPAALGAQTGVDPVRIGLVLSTQYRRDASWEPAQLSAAEALIELIPHTFPSPDRAADTLATLSASLSPTVKGLKGERGDAAQLAPLLLAHLGGD